MSFKYEINHKDLGMLIECLHRDVARRNTSTTKEEKSETLLQLVSDRECNNKIVAQNETERKEKLELRRLLAKYGYPFKV